MKFQVLCLLATSAALATATGQGTTTSTTSSSSPSLQPPPMGSPSLQPPPMGQLEAAKNGTRSRNLIMQPIARYDWKLCDQCKSNPNDLCLAQGLLRTSRRKCSYAPCDPNNDLVNNRGWFCQKGTSAVLVPFGSKQTGRDIGRGNGLTIKPSHPANKPQGFEIIPPQQALNCVPCSSTDNGKWCEPDTGKQCGGNSGCQACEELFPGNSDLQGRGWFCNSASKSPQVCVNEHNYAIIDYMKFAVYDAASNTTTFQVPAKSYAASINKKRCKDTAICLWGSVAAAVLLIIATAGTISAFAVPSAAALGPGLAPLALSGDALIMATMSSSASTFSAAMTAAEMGFVVVAPVGAAGR